MSQSRNAPRNRLIQIIVLLGILFVAFGDQLKFLPLPARQASYNSRTFVVSLWPKWLRPRNTNEQRDKQINEMEKGPAKK